jgi:hypothetical protein
MQCAIVVLITIGFLIISLSSLRSRSGNPHSKALRNREALLTGAVEFHKAQCFFSLTIQIASLVYNICMFLASLSPSSPIMFFFFLKMLLIIGSWHS